MTVDTEVFRRQVRALRAVAGDVRDLEHHADEVEATKAAIRAAQAWVDDQVSAAHRLLANAADAVADTVTGAYETATGVVERSRDVISLVFASAPEPGSIDWLQLRDRIEHR